MAKIAFRAVEIALLAVALRFIIWAVVYNADQKKLERTGRVALPANTERDLGFKPHYGGGCQPE